MRRELRRPGVLAALVAVALLVILAIASPGMAAAQETATALSGVTNGDVGEAAVASSEGSGWKPGSLATGIDVATALGGEGSHRASFFGPLPPTDAARRPVGIPAGAAGEHASMTLDDLLPGLIGIRPAFVDAGAYKHGASLLKDIEAYTLSAADGHRIAHSTPDQTPTVAPSPVVPLGTTGDGSSAPLAALAAGWHFSEIPA